VEPVRISGTDILMSRASLGTMTFGSQVSATDAARFVDVSLERGINVLDCANIYNAGKSEEVLAPLLKGRRNKVILTSKVAGKAGDAPDQVGLSAKAIKRCFDESLKRLATDYLDIYYLHWPDYTVPMEETLAAMDELVRAGKVKVLGASNFSSWQVAKMVELAKQNGWAPIRVVQPMYNLVSRRPDDEFLPMCKEYKLTNVIYNPLAGGLLSGKHNREKPIEGTRFDGNKGYLDRYWSNANFEAVEELKRIADGAGRTLIGLSLSWLAHHRPVDSILLGASKLEQLTQNLDELEKGPLDAAVLTACDDVWKRLQGPSPKYNR
jgi:1-deoxyxylulose-5-phosphate synthase